MRYLSAILSVATLFLASFSGYCLPQGIKAGLLPMASGPTMLGDPVLVQLQVKNESSGPIGIRLPTLDRYAPASLSFAIREPGARSFRAVEFPGVYTGADKMLAPHRIVQALTLLPGLETNIIFQLDYDFPNARKRRFLFQHPGHYAVKAEIMVFRSAAEIARVVPIDTPVDVLEVGPLEFDVVQPTEPADQAALEAMRKLPFEYLIYAPDKFDELAHKGAVDQINRFVITNQGSRYASFGQFFVSYVNWKKAQEQQNFDQVATAIAQIAQATNALPFLHPMATRLLKVRQPLVPESINPQLLKPDVVMVAMKELESQWYDVKGFTRRSPEGQKAYIDRLLPLHEELAGGKLSEEAYEVKHAELLKECVRKFSSPLAPEEWKKRYEEYAAQEARDSAQRAAQDESARRRIIEQLERPTQPKQ